MQKSVIRFVITLFTTCFAAVVPSFAAEVPSPSDIRIVERLEQYLYEKPQTGELAERLSKLEMDLLGKKLNKTIARRAANLNTLVFKGAPSAPPLNMKLNFLEWKVFKESRTGKLADRVAALDKKICGQIASEPLAFRVEQLLQMTVDSGVLSLHPVKIPAGKRLLVKSTVQISSAEAKPGDIIPMVVSSDLLIDKSILAVSRGTPTIAEVETVRQGGRFGRSGFMKLLVNEVNGVDSTPIPVCILGLAGSEFDKKKLGMAAGASALGYLAMGPVGLVGGAFVKGQDVIMPANTEIELETIEPVQVMGIVVDTGY